MILLKYIKYFFICVLFINNNYLFSQKSFKEASSAKDVIENYLEAIGGKSKVKKIKSQKINLLVTASSNKMEGEVLILSPNRYSFSLANGNELIQKQVLNINQGFKKNQEGVFDLTDDEKMDLGYKALIYWELLYDDFGYELELLGTKVIDDIECYKIEITNKQGNTRFNYYDTANGLKVREESEMLFNDSIINVYTDFFEYKTIDEVKIPFKKVLTFNNQTIIMDIIFIDNKTKIPENKFILE